MSLLQPSAQAICSSYYVVIVKGDSVEPPFLFASHEPAAVSKLICIHPKNGHTVADSSAFAYIAIKRAARHTLGGYVLTCTPPE